MKKYVLFLTAFLTALRVTAGDEKPQKVEAPIKSVIIYLTGAEVTHRKKVTLEAGRNLLVFTGLSSKLISKSIQFTAGSSVSILSISDRIDYLSSQQRAENRGRQLSDSLTGSGDKVTQLQYDIQAYTEEKALLQANQELSGKDKGVTAAELKLAADFYRTRIREINAELIRLDKAKRTETELQNRLRKQLAEMNATNSPPVAEITILLTVAAPTSVETELKYVVNDAGWAPSYDLLAEDVSKPIELRYRAKVFNNTNVDWKDVNVKLSTADPMRSASKPELSTWFLNYSTGSYESQASQNYYREQKDNSNSLELQQRSIPAANGYYGGATGRTEDLKKNGPVTAPIQFEEIQVSELSAEFEIKQPYSVPSDAKPYIIDVSTHTLPATYIHFSAPKIDRDAFLLARITGWEALDLVEGPANIYFGDTYVGQSYIATRTADDTLDLSLGRDNKVLVTRAKLQDFNNAKLIGNSKRVTQGFEITAKNNRKGPVTITIEDQLPISQDAEITVEALETSKAEYEAATGKLTWKMTLQPGEVRKITLQYSVKYPKSKTVILQKTERKSRAKF
jgi:uncharacterized protein (TIGR02231 family)